MFLYSFLLYSSVGVYISSSKRLDASQMCDESPCIHQVTLALSLLCLFSPFPSLVAVLSPGVVQNNTHTETPNRSNAFLEFQITIACARAWEALWVSDTGLIAQCQPHLPPRVHLSPLTSWLSSRLTPPHLGNTSACNTTPARARSHRALMSTH